MTDVMKREQKACIEPAAKQEFPWSMSLTRIAVEITGEAGAYWKSPVMQFQAEPAAAATGRW